MCSSFLTKEISILKKDCFVIQIVSMFIQAISNHIGIHVAMDHIDIVVPFNDSTSL